jgi:hypothetical protein
VAVKPNEWCYLARVHTDLRLNFEVYASWDYVRLASEGSQGTPVMFEKHPSGEGFSIKMAAANYADHIYFATDSKGWVYLDKKEKATSYSLYEFTERGTTELATPIWCIRNDGTMGYFKIDDNKDKRWLTTDGYDLGGGNSSRTLFEFIRA